jgi:hypothetical protein
MLADAMADDREAQAEWARMQGLGGALQRRRLLATLASSAVLGVGFLGSVFLFFFWPYERVPIVALGVPIAVMLPLAWAVRTKLWTRGQFR